MFEHFGISPREHGFKTVGKVSAAFEIVGDDESDHTAEKLKGADVRTDPIMKLLSESGFGVSVVRGAERGDEDLRMTNFAGQWIKYWDGRAAIVDEHLVAGRVRLSHCRRESLAPFSIEHAEV